MIALEPGAAGAFMQRLGPAIDAAVRPAAGDRHRLGAHRGAHAGACSAAARHEAIYDFGGFDPTLYARCATTRRATRRCAARARRCCARPASTRSSVDEGGLDHGAWTALRYIYPDADIPIVPLAFVPSDPPAQQFALGEALAPLADDGVLVLGSGSITHNLRRVLRAAACMPPTEQPEIPRARRSARWIAERAAARDWDALFDYRRQAPHAVDMHPTDEHLLPWYVAAGAGGRDAVPQRLHASATMGSLGMDAYAFGPPRRASPRRWRPGSKLHEQRAAATATICGT